jgi:electron transport complex protein RnfE
VVNCIILGRAEAFASKNGIGDSMLDGLGMGLGFTGSLTLLGIVREILGNGSVFGAAIFGASYQPAIIMILPPGGFLALGLLMAFFSALPKKQKQAE